MRPDLEMLHEWQAAEQSDSVYCCVQHCKSGKPNYTQRDNDNSIWNGKLFASRFCLTVLVFL